MRAAPPGLAARGERWKVFSSSLEQSEQLLSAAALTPPEARPMLIFYGLAQGCRALLACAPTVTDAQFRNKGHGLRERRLRGPIESMSIEATHSGISGALCRLLDFTEFETPVTFAQLWAINPHLFQRPLAGSLQPPCVTTNCGLDLTVLSQLAVLYLGFLGTDLGGRLSTPAAVAESVRSNYGPFPFDILELDPRSNYTDRYFRETWVDLNVHVSRAEFMIAEAHIEARIATVGYNTWMLPQTGGVISRPNSGGPCSSVCPFVPGTSLRLDQGPRPRLQPDCRSTRRPARRRACSMPCPTSRVDQVCVRSPRRLM